MQAKNKQNQSVVNRPLPEVIKNVLWTNAVRNYLFPAFG